MNNLVLNTEQTMSSSQLSTMLGYEKKEINKKIRSMFGEEIARETFSPALDSQNRISEYLLPEVESKMLVASLDINYLRQITEYWVGRNNFNSLQFEQRIKQKIKQELLEELKPKVLQNPDIEILDKRYVVKVRIYGYTLHLGYVRSKEAKIELLYKWKQFIKIVNEKDIYKLRDLFFIEITGEKYKRYNHKFKYKDN